ncbi:hypothetical protein KO481_11575 [Nocardia sp. NEAU-G5]|uniref:Uncharacterized protein n=1 Tax=Nocardia albiluteola TaxID=2842303 RepID=A0ABS6AVW2_9NOCA|nr:hypothetical protein [Nocardia albiluteola]MBU3062162.1 hypothetical protein [Nocardia albiluteola]
MPCEAVFDSICDDAAIFPPGNLPLAEALAAHPTHHRAWYSALVGSFVLSAAHIGGLPGVPHERLAISLTLPQGPAGLEPAIAALSELPGIGLESVEVALPQGCTFAELATAAAGLGSQVARYLEVPRDERREAILNALPGSGFRAKFRTGGVVPEAHPSERELAEAIHGAVRRRVPFKCTAGLHHAVRHRDGELEQHGFVNVLLATDAARSGGDIDELTGILGERSGDALVRWLREAGEQRLLAARSSFVSFGTCSIADPVADLVELGLIDRPHGDDEPAPRASSARPL